MTGAQELFDTYLQALQGLRSEKDFYAFEEQFAKLHTEFGRQLPEQQLQKPKEESSSYKKKSSPDSVS